MVLKEEYKLNKWYWIFAGFAILVSLNSISNRVSSQREFFGAILGNILIFWIIGRLVKKYGKPKFFIKGEKKKKETFFSAWNETRKEYRK